MSEATSAVIEALAGEAGENPEVFFAERPRLINEEIARALLADATRRFRGGTSESKLLIGCAEWLAEQLASPELVALSLRARANLHHFLNDYREADGLYQEAIQLFDAQSAGLQSAITKSSGLVNSAYLGNHDQVSRWLSQAESVFRREGDQKRLASLLNNEAGVSFRRDRWADAAAGYLEALNIFSDLDQELEVAVCRRNVASCLIALRRFDEGLREYEMCRAFCEGKDLGALAAEADYNIAYLYFLRGEYDRASWSFERAREAAHRRGDRYHAALCDLDQAELSIELNLIEEARGLAERASDEFLKLELSYERARALVWSAVAGGRKGEYKKAIELFAEASRLFGKEGNLRWLSRVGLYQAELHLAHGEVSEAKTALVRATDLLKDQSAPQLRASIKLLESEVELGLGALSAARDRLAGAEKLTSKANPVLSWKIDLLASRLSEVEGDLVSGLARLESASSTLDSLWLRLGGDEQRIHFLADKNQVHEGLFALNRRSGRLAQAYSAIQRAKSPSLAEIMTYGLSDSRLEDEGLDRPTLELAREQRALQHEANHRHALYGDSAELGASRARTASLDEVASRLEGRTLLEFFVARGVVVAAVVRNGDLKFVELGAVRPILEAQRLLSFRLGRCGEEGNVNNPVFAKAIESSLQSLFDQVVRPLVPSLEGEAIVVSPHSFLHQIPFHALCNEDGFVLGLRHRISYVPSGTVLSLCSRRAVGRGVGSLVLSVPDVDAPNVAREARDVASHLGGDILEGRDATAAALEERGRTARYIHIATHGRFRRDNSLYSSLQLGDRDFTALDFHRTELVADLVSLSGCATGVSALAGADEQLGLVRGVLFAGARAALASLWEVADGSGAEVIDRFYRHVSEGESFDLALQRAMVWAKSEYESPFRWAPFVLVGAV